MNINFGKLNCAVKKYLGENHEKQEAYNFVKQYINILKESNILEEQFYLYNTLETVNSNVYETVKNSINMMNEKYTPHKINKSNEILLQFIKENISVNLNEIEDNELFESIDYLLKNKQTVKNFNLIENKINKITNLIESNLPLDEPICEEELPELNEEEDDVLKKLSGISPEERERFFDVIKTECLKRTINLIKENTNDSELVSKLTETQNVILNKEFTSESFIEEYVNLCELKQNLS